MAEFKCEYCGRDDFGSPGARTAHENNYCSERPAEEPKSKYDLLAEESCSVDFPGTLFGVPISTLMMEGSFLDHMRDYLVRRGDDPQDWRALRVGVEV